MIALDSDHTGDGNLHTGTRTHWSAFLSSVEGRCLFNLDPGKLACDHGLCNSHKLGVSDG